ncbi:universal stress protein [Aequorivita sp. F47161]|uniref:Universal stress protein n=1 Tax=Aequorivita vitellina TaxID=2874475 RepID=A0A9X1U4C3_9FLAO|nr:universal stress protein [Aequorivita vitellina]MCG2420152.1 universal stress protein [Aequorivita vitellina]MCZ4319073.1 universal stress protein [Aequorivita viscosa]
MNVLIPTDFSENSHNAIRYALDYFADIPVNFYLLHTARNQASHNEEPELFFETTTKNNTIQGSMAGLTEEIKTFKLLAKNTGHQFFAIYEKALLVEAIRKQVAEKEIDYILMGTKGASKENRHEIGSNTSEVITKVKCPIFVIPENARFKNITNISFLTDYNCIYRNKVISGLSEALKLQKAALRVLHIRSQNAMLNAAQTDNKGFLHYFFKDIKHSFHFLDNKNIEAGVQDFVETWEIDMIAVVAKNLNLTQRLLFKRINLAISYPYEVPFLILHE